MSFIDIIHRAVANYKAKMGVKIEMAEDVIPMMSYMFSEIREPVGYTAEALAKYNTNEEKIADLVEDIIERAYYGSVDAKFDFIDAYSVWHVVKEDIELSEMLRTDYIDIPPGIIAKRAEDHPEKVEYPAYGGLLKGYVNQVMPKPSSVTKEEWRRRQIWAEELYTFLHNHFMESDIVHLNLNNVYDEIIRLAKNDRQTR